MEKKYTSTVKACPETRIFGFHLNDVVFETKPTTQLLAVFFIKGAGDEINRGNKYFLFLEVVLQLVEWA